MPKDLFQSEEAQGSAGENKHRQQQPDPTEAADKPVGSGARKGESTPQKGVRDPPTRTSSAPEARERIPFGYPEYQ